MPHTLQETLEAAMYLLGIAAVWWIASLLLAWSDEKTAAEEWLRRETALRACSPAARMPSRGFLGLGRLAENLRATREGRGPQYVVSAMDSELGPHVHTCAVHILDYKLLVTREPANVQAIFATRAADWDVSEHRVASWRPLVGHGIFTSRGEH